MSDKNTKPILVAPVIGSTPEPIPEETRKQFPPESEGLAALGGNGFVIGLTPGVNDESAHVVPEFQPTRHELVVLAKHYFNEARDTEYWWELVEQTGSSERRSRDFAYLRLDAIANILGDEAVNEATSELASEWEERFASLLATERCDRCGIRHEPGECSRKVDD